MTMEEILKYLFSAGGASAAVSFILEQIPAFQNLASDLKKWIFFGATVAVSLGAFAVLTYVPPETLKALEPWVIAVVGIFTSQFLGTLYHKQVK